MLSKLLVILASLILIFLSLVFLRLLFYWRREVLLAERLKIMEEAAKETPEFQLWLDELHLRQGEVTDDV